jgi:DNA-binding NtrC family response regulator
MINVCVAVADETLNRTLFESLRQLGHDVVSVYNAQAMFHRLDSQRFDVLMIGSSCTIVDGKSIAPFLERTYAGMAIIVVCGTATDEALTSDLPPLAGTLDAPARLSKTRCSARFTANLSRDHLSTPSRERSLAPSCT